MKIKDVAIIVNTDKDPGLEKAEYIKELLSAGGVVCQIYKDLKVKESDKAGDEWIGLRNADCALVLGGDGTLLAAARSLRGIDMPLIGINLGTLGYLAEVELSFVGDAVNQLISGDFFIEERMMLNGSLPEIKESALNDIVITRKGSIQIIDLNVWVNGQFITNYQADGIIISTPTGSTGYNLSAGGPIVSPEAQAILLTPISPHSLANRSVVLSPEDTIRIEIGEGRRGSEPSVEASFDGSLNLSLKPGDIIEVSRSPMTTRFLRLKRVSFFEVLRRKL